MNEIEKLMTSLIDSLGAKRARGSWEEHSVAMAYGGDKLEVEEHRCPQRRAWVPWFELVRQSDSI
jgi:hypothetical protein